MKKRIFYIILSVVFIILAVLVTMNYLNDKKKHEVKEIVYNENYPEIYSDQLLMIFGPSMQISEKENMISEGEDCSCGFHSDTLIYDEWIITYEGTDGQTYKQTMDNMSSLEELQVKWMKDHLMQYIKMKYMIGYFETGTFEDLSLEESFGRSYCSITLVSGVSSYTTETEKEYDRICEAGKTYYNDLLLSLQEQENILPLYQLSMEKLCQKFPLHIRMDMSLNDEELTGKDKEAFEKSVEEKILQMVNEINEESGNRCCLSVRVNSANGKNKLYDGKKSWTYCFTQGKESELSGFDFDYEVFYSYEGIYW